VTIFDRALLDLPNPASSPRIHAQMEKLAQARLAALPTVETVSARVLRLLEGQVGQRVLDLDDIAEMMGISARTLQRRLSEEHTSFQKLHDGLRYRLACELLRKPDADIPTIAATLGFSEPATFHRAFRQWSGMSVTDYRRRPAAGDTSPGTPAD
ncbi:MAG: helix-turn-helix domain-containing protein, partial [Gammaproteobacteria bacterium]